jgi:acetyltransferase-like isoleucine patch superfamily enzyme
MVPDAMYAMITKFLRRFRLSNFYSIARNNHVRFACDARKTRLRVTKGTGNKVVVDDSVTAYDATIIIEGSDNTLVVEQGSYLRGRIELIGNGNVITIGRRSVIGGGMLMAHHGTRIAIGDDCLFAASINVRTSDSHSILDASGRRINPEKNIHIGNRVWFGCDVTVLKGSTIGNDVVVGTLSMVSGHLPDKVVAAGIPARVIRENTTWCQQIV